MKPFLSIFIFLFACGLSGLAQLQLISRETFQGVGTLDSRTPGNLGTVVGTFYKRAVGPKVTGDLTANGLGWSGDAHNSNPYHYWSVAAGLGTGYSRMICGWFYLGNITSNGSSGNSMKLLWAGDAIGQNMCSIEISNVFTNGTAPVSGIFVGNGFTPPSSPVTIIPGWYFFALAAVFTPHTFDTVTWRAYYMPQGGTALTQIGNDVSTGGQATGGAFYGGFNSNTSNLFIQGRYGCAAEYSISSFNDVAVPGDLVAPPAGGRNWYVNPATGNDNNDGLSPSPNGNGGGPWQTDAKIDSESANLGMFPVTTGYGTGDTLNVDCSTAPLVIGPHSLTINTSGLAIKQHGTPGAADPRTGNLGCDPMITIGGTWSLVSGSTSIYQNTDGGSTDLDAVVIFEDDHDGKGLKYLNHPIGTSLAGSVQTALDATPGSFWTDGTTLYLHPFTNTNPATDQNLYRRTRNRDIASSAITINAPDVWWDGLVISGTTLAANGLGVPIGAASANDPLGAYCFQWNTGKQIDGGINLLSNFKVDNYGKHGVGRTSGGSNSIMTRENGIYGQSTPYYPGASSSDVDFSGDLDSTNNQGIYINCTETVNIGVIGSSAGTVNPGIPSYISHASDVAFSLVSFTNCFWAGALSEQGDVAQMTLTKTTCSQCTAALNLTCDESRATPYGVLYTNGSGSQLILRNCILAPTIVPPASFWNLLPTTALIEGCTFDLSAAPGGGPKAIFARSYAGSTVTFRNCLVLGTSGDTRGLLSGFSSSDAITMDHNAYAADIDDVSLSYNDGTITADRSLAQWQSLGFDANSFNTAQSLLVNDVPQTSSPLINAGADLAPAVTADYTGAVFTSRKTIGAFEPVLSSLTFPQWQYLEFGDSAASHLVSGATAIPFNDGVPNLLKYAYHIDPTKSMSASDFARLPVSNLDTTTTPGTAYFTLQYYNNPLRGGITINVQTSPDLLNWQTVPTAQLDVNRVLKTDATTGDSLIEAGVKAGVSREFIRLNVTNP